MAKTRPRKRGFGTVRQLPSGNWQARYPDPRYTGTGRPPRLSAPHTFRTKAEADAWLASTWTDINRGTWKHPEDAKADREREQARAQLEALTVRQWAETWLEHMRPRWRYSTYEDMESRIRLHVLPRLGRYRLIDLTERQCRNALDAAPEGARRTVHSALRQLLLAAVASEDTALTVSPHPDTGYTKRTPRKRRAYLFTAQDVEAIANAIRPEAHALVLLLADAGLRLNEALALRMCDVDLSARPSVDVNASMNREHGGQVRGETKNPGSIRRVPITGATADALMAHCEAYCDTATPDAPLFPSPSSTAIHLADNTFRTWLTTAQKAIGLVVPQGHHANAHAFRHYSATMFGQTGAGLRQILDRYGWSRPEQAITYMKSDEDAQRASLELMEERQRAALAVTDLAAERRKRA